MRKLEVKVRQHPIINMQILFSLSEKGGSKSKSMFLSYFFCNKDISIINKYLSFDV